MQAIDIKSTMENAEKISGSSAVSKLAKAWEAKNAKKATKASGLSLMALSLAACGGSDSDGEGAPTPDSNVNAISMVGGVDNIDTNADVVTGTIGVTSELQEVQEDLSTYEQGDAVNGDGSTSLEVTVNGLGGSDFTSPDVDVSNVDTLVIVDENGQDVLTFDAANFDGNVQNITLQTATNGSTFSVDVVDFVASANSFNLTMNPLSDTTGNIHVIDAELVVDGANDHYTRLDANVGSNGDDDGATASSVTLTPGEAADVITLSAGTEGIAELHLEAIDSGFASSGPADVGPISMDITADAAKQGEVELELTMQAVGTNSATVDEFAITDFDVTLARDSDGSHVGEDEDVFNVDNGNHFVFDLNATVTDVLTGDATASVADVSVSDIVVTGANGSTVDVIEIDTHAAVTASADGSATVGNTTVGDVSITLGNGGEVGLLQVSKSADFGGDSGAAVAGNTTVGDIAINIGDNAGSVDVDVDNNADNNGTGDATVGTTTVGNITIAAGDDASGEYLLDVAPDADAGEGNALLGDVAVGNVNVSLGDDSISHIDVELTAQATAVTGDATVGDVSISSVTVSRGDDAVFTDTQDLLNVLAAGSAGTGDVSVGALSVGNVDIVSGVDGSGAMSATIGAFGQAASGDLSIASVSVGTISVERGSGEVDDNITVGVEGSAVGDATVGDVTLGGLTAVVGESVSLDYQAGIDLVASSTSSGDVGGSGQIGNVSFGSIDATVNSGASSVTISNGMEVGAPDLTIGTIAVGNVSVTANEANEDVTVGVLGVMAGAEDLTVGDMSVGDLTLNSSSTDGTGDIDAGVNVLLLNTSGDSAGPDLTVGNILSSVGSLGVVNIDMSIAGEDIGDVTLGNVSMTGADVGTDITVVNSGAFDLDVTVSGDNVGNLTVGNIGLAFADGQQGSVNLDLSGVDEVGDVTVGNLTVSVADDGAFSFSASNTADDTSGDVTVGDISLTREVNSLSSAFFIRADSQDGDVTIGDISLSGEQRTVSGTAENFTSVFNLSAGSGDGDVVTVGDIDYSGYSSLRITGTGSTTEFVANTVTIDFSNVDGVANVYAASTDTVIVDNADGNNIYLGAGDDTVVLNDENTGGLETTESGDFVGVADVENAIYNIALGDVIDFNANSGDVLLNSTGVTYSAFMSDADSALDASSVDVYIGKVGTSYFAAVDVSDQVTDADVENDVDYVVMLDMNDVTAAAINVANDFIA